MNEEKQIFHRPYEVPLMQLLVEDVDEFLEMLDERENDVDVQQLKGPNTWLYLAALAEMGDDGMVRRWVQSQFVYGDVIITYRLLTSHSKEQVALGEPFMDDQQKALASLKAELEQKREELGMHKRAIKMVRLVTGGMW